MKFGKKNNEKRITTHEENFFYLLHLSLLRDYLDLEFTPLKAILPFPYDLEQIIDDWVWLLVVDCPVAITNVQIYYFLGADGFPCG